MDFYYWGIVNLLSPPYGDGTAPRGKDTGKAQFSPPYGDCTNMRNIVRIGDAFSPPYGDCTLNISQNTAKLKSQMARKYLLYYNDVLLR